MNQSIKFLRISLNEVCRMLVIARLAYAMLSKYHYGMWAWRHAQTSLCGWHNWRGTDRWSHSSELITLPYLITCLTTLNTDQVRLFVLLLVVYKSALRRYLQSQVCDDQEKETRTLSLRVVFYGLKKPLQFFF